jgi:hypothetical protein
LSSSAGVVGAVVAVSVSAGSVVAGASDVGARLGVRDGVGSPPCAGALVALGCRVRVVGSPSLSFPPPCVARALVGPADAPGTGGVGAASLSGTSQPGVTKARTAPASASSSTAATPATSAGRRPPPWTGAGGGAATGRTGAGMIEVSPLRGALCSSAGAASRAVVWPDAFACSAAAAIAAADANRSAGFFAIARATRARTGSGTSSGSGGASSCRCCMATARGLSPWNGGCPARQW